MAPLRADGNRCFSMVRAQNEHIDVAPGHHVIRLPARIAPAPPAHRVIGSQGRISDAAPLASPWIRGLWPNHSPGLEGDVRRLEGEELLALVREMIQDLLLPG
jgi:hypothetical protein